jgi:hypothetical protein
MKHDGPEINALLLPTEEPPLDIAIKRAILMYDKVLIPDYRETHLIPEGVIHDDYGRMKIIQSAFAPYPRVMEYESSWEYLLNNCSSLWEVNTFPDISLSDTF